jgi:hypothetical protein
MYMLAFKGFPDLGLLSSVLLLANIAVKKKNFHKSWHLDKKAKSLVVAVLILGILISIFAFLPKGDQATSDRPNFVASSTPTPVLTDPTKNTSTPTVGPEKTQKPSPTVTHPITPIPKPPGIIESAQNMNSTFWQKIAETAWKYYSPDVGVDLGTGLPWTSTGSPYITDWDVGVYIQSLIDASKLNLTQPMGDWGFNSRVDKVLKFLETRNLNNFSYPFWFYQSFDGKVWHQASDTSTEPVDVVDTGRLFVALNNLRNYDSNFTVRVNNLVYNKNGNRSNYAAIVPSIVSEGNTSTSIYSYIISSGFASFWPNELSTTPVKILDNIYSPANGNITVNGVAIPKSAITTDVLLTSVLDINSSDNRLKTLMNQTYLAHEAYYNQTNKFRAFAEGPQLSSNWQWGWVVFPDGRYWVALGGNYQEIDVPPMIYTQVAIGFLALYNTTFSRNLCVYLERINSEPKSGFLVGADEDGNPLNGFSIHTNGLILGAALHAIQKLSLMPD